MVAMTDTPTNVPDLTPADLARIMEAARVNNEQRDAERAAAREARATYLVSTGLADMYVLLSARRDLAYKQAYSNKRHGSTARPSHATEAWHAADGRLDAFLGTVCLLLETRTSDLVEALSQASEGRIAHDAANALRARTNNGGDLRFGW